MQREMIHFQDKENELVAAKLSELQRADLQLYEVVKYVLKINGIYQDVFLYICEHPYKTREINYKLMHFLGTGAGPEWFELITRTVRDYDMEQAALPYCVECIHQAFLSGLTVKKTEDVLANSRSLPELSKNFKLLLLNVNAETKEDIPPLEEQGHKSLNKTVGQERLTDKSTFLKERMEDYKGYVRIPIKVFYSEIAGEEYLTINGEGDIFDIVDKMLKKVRRSMSAYQRRIDTLNKIMVSKEEQLRSLSNNSGEEI